MNDTAQPNTQRPLLQFEEARTFARSLGLAGAIDWQRYVRSAGRRDLRTSADRVYARLGWRGWGDFLGTGNVRIRGPWRKFASARSFVRTLRLRDQADWMQYCSGDSSKRLLPPKPADIPRMPNMAYKDKGWCGYVDFLGCGQIRRQRRHYRHNCEFRSFEAAREFVRKLGLPSARSWREEYRSGLLKGLPKLPDDIPSSPEITYRGKGWTDWFDFLGKATLHTASGAKHNWRSYQDVLVLVHGLGLKNHLEWCRYCRSGAKPNDIPANPSLVYRGFGWKNWQEFLGKEKVRTI